MSSDTPVKNTGHAELARGIGEKARLARKRADLTQEEVAEQIGVATEVYGRIERGRMMPSVPTLFRLCVALRVSADAAFGLVEEARVEPVHGAESQDPRELRKLLRKLRAMDRRHLHVFIRVLAAMSRVIIGRDRPVEKPRERGT